MSQGCLAACLLLAVLSVPAGAVEIPVAEHLVLEVVLADGWTLCTEDPPAELVRETARHLAHEPAAAQATAEQIEAVARRRLAANEAILYHAASGAHLDIDFSPLAEGEAQPDAGAVKRSAEIAALSLERETDLSAVTWSISRFSLSGAGEAYLLAADYRQHGKPVKHLGVVGVGAGTWFYLYGFVPGDAPRVYGEIQEMLVRAQIRRARP